MRLISKLVLIGGAAAALAGTALAAGEAEHVLNVRLPGGAIQQIRYTGDIVPRVVLVPVGAAAALPVDFISPFAEMDRISAAIDAQMDAMLQQAASLSTAAEAQARSGATMASGSAPAANAFSYSYVSTSNGQATCTRSVQMTSYGASATPKVVSQQSGDCSAMAKPLVEAASPAPAPARAEQPALTKARLDTAPARAPITRS